MPYIVTRETTLSDGAVNNIDVPMPAGHQAGDMTVLMITQDGGGTNILNPGAEFTIIGSQAAAQAQRTIAYQRIHAGSGEADVNFTGSTDEWIVTAILIRGATTLSIDQNNRTNSANSTSNFLTSGSVTTSVDNCLILSAFGRDDAFKLGLNNTSLNKSVNLSKEINVGCVQITQYFNQLTAGATDTLTALSEVSSEGGSALIVAVRETTPSTAIMPPMITKAYDVVARYGGITTAATTVAAFIRHDGITWADANGTIVPTTIGSLDLATIATFAEVTLQGGLSNWGSMTGLSHTGSGLDNTGRWFGRTHTVSLDMTGKIFSVEFMTSQVAASRLGPEGCLVYFEDNSGNWRAFQMSRRQGMVANIAYVFFADVEQTTPYDESGTMDWSKVTRIAYLLHKRTTSTVAVILRVKNALLLDKVIMVDGSSASPCSPAFLQRVLGGDNPAVGGHGAYLLATVQGKGQALARFGVQYGNGSRKTYTDFSATSFELPLRADASLAKRFWGVEDNAAAAEVVINAGPDDVFNSTACVIATDVEQDLIVDAGSDPSADYSFAGSSIIGWNIIHDVAGITINGATISNCRVTLNGGLIDGCTITNSKAPIQTDDPEGISNCDFISPGTGYAITITGAGGTFDLFGNTFSGYGADSTANAAIRNETGGAVTINLGQGDAVPTVDNSFGSTTTIVPFPVTASATVLADSRVQIYNVTTATELDNVFLAGTAYSFNIGAVTSGHTLRLRVTKKGRTAWEGSAVYGGAGIVFVPSQPADDVYDIYALDGATVTGFAANYGNTTVERTNNSNFTGASFYAWWSFNLTTVDGIRNFFGGLTATDTANIRINNAVLDLNFDITVSDNVYQSDNIRIFRVDEAYPVVNPTVGAGGIDLNWRNVVFPFASGSGVTSGDIEAIADAVWDEANADHVSAGSTGSTLRDAKNAAQLAGALSA